MANINQMIADLDRQIEGLQTAKQALIETAQVFEDTNRFRSSSNFRGVMRSGTNKPRRTMSPEAREKIAAAQRARWAKAGKEVATPKREVAKKASEKKSALKQVGGYRPKAKKQPAESRAAHLVPAQAEEPVATE